jgi:mannose-1-phosphate guanylyltransferase / mannose-6-phosphate isomerase
LGGASVLRAIQPVILSGGFGTRLWPASRDSMPKQLLKIIGNRSSFQDTLQRVGVLSRAASPLIVANEAHRFLLAQQAMENETELAGLLTEPLARDTAAAVAMAAVWLTKQGGDPLLLIMPADHHIEPADQFAAQVELAVPAAAAGRIVVFGTKPRWASSSFGYIKKGMPDAGSATHAVAAFTEKPKSEEACRYIETGEYLWNCGLVLSLASTLLSEFRKYRPDILDYAAAAVTEAVADRDFVRLAEGPLESCPKISLDYAILEKSNLVSVRELEGVEWSDVGTWAEIHALSPRDEHSNALADNAIFVDARNCFAHVEGDRMAALVGVSNLVLISTPDVVFVGPLDSADALKSMVQKLRATHPELVSGNREKRKSRG